MNVLRHLHYLGQNCVNMHQSAVGVQVARLIGEFWKIVYPMLKNS